jgi:hypothetical protein
MPVERQMTEHEKRLESVWYAVRTVDKRLFSSNGDTVPKDDLDHLCITVERLKDGFNDEH